MDDLKVVLYVVIAIVWMIYNNYKKIGSESKKRDPSKPQREIIEENWPVEDDVNTSQTSKEQPVVVDKKPLERIEIPVPEKINRKPLVRKGLASKKRKEPLFLSTNEGGMIQPSESVIFEDQETDDSFKINWISKIKNSDYKHAFVMSEILRRPYS